MNRPYFLSGLFVLCFSVLVLQIALTRVLSVMTFFHVAFLAISVAMLGLTAGATWVYARRVRAEQVASFIQKSSLAYGITTVIMMLFLAATFVPSRANMTQVASIAKIILLTGIPFSLAGVAISLALTRGPGKIGLRYAVDLLGAASGCLCSLLLLTLIPAPAVIILAGGLGIISSWLFWRSTQETPSGALPRPEGFSYISSLAVVGILVMLCGGGFSLLPLLSLKSEHITSTGIESEYWNSFSQIIVTPPYGRPNFYWGEGTNTPVAASTQRFIAIDGMAGTPMYKFDGQSYDSLGFLSYDVTNVAYAIRNSGRAAIIGVGGGRDVLAARHFGFKDVTVVELNPLMVDLLTTKQPYADFAGLNKDPAIRFIVDDGRSWFARTQDKFDLIQMSVVDTWAATGAGSFTLSENGLYTIEGWKHFLNALSDTGVFTVSRWHDPANLNEAARMVSLAKAALFAMGIADPDRHIHLTTASHLATLTLARAPLTPQDLKTLDEVAKKSGFQVAIKPGEVPSAPTMAGIMQAKTPAELEIFSRRQLLDLSPPSDSRPFFFNQLKLSTLLSPQLGEVMQGIVVPGNLKATFALLMIILVSAYAVLHVIFIPAIRSLTSTNRSYTRAGTLWFLLIGLGFMFVEIGTIQRMSLFLGHPVYGLSIVLFSLILFTGLGSFFSDVFPLTRYRSRIVAWGLSVAGVVAVTTFIAPPILAQQESSDIVIRALVAIGLIAPGAFLMGFGFPTGMALAEKIDATPTPWFWAINGAAGVLGSGLAVLISLTFSIPTTLLLGALCYGLLVFPALRLARISP